MKNKKLTNLLSAGPIAVGTAITNPGLAPKTGSFSINSLIANIMQWLFWVIGFIALAALLYGGFLYITAGGDSDKTTKARNTILYALLGIFIVVASAALISWVTTGSAWNFLRGTGTTL